MSTSVALSPPLFYRRAFLNTPMRGEKIRCNWPRFTSVPVSTRRTRRVRCTSVVSETGAERCRESPQCTTRSVHVRVKYRFDAPVVPRRRRHIFSFFFCLFVCLSKRENKSSTVFGNRCAHACHHLICRLY